MLNSGKTMTRTFCCVALSVGALGACADAGTSDDGSELEPQSELGTQVFHSQCGSSWDVQDVELYDGTLGVSQAFVAAHERRVADATGLNNCTGTLISDDLLLSAGHCGFSVGNTVHFDRQLTPTMNVRGAVAFKVAEVVEQEDNDSWDYAILRLDGAAGREFGHASIAPIDPPVGSTLTLIGHPDEEIEVVHAAPVVGVWASNPNWLMHRIDTRKGSSGAGLLDVQGRLVGVHTDSACDKNLGANLGMRMSKLVPHSRTLQQLAQSRLLFRSSQGQVALWRVDHQGTVTANQIFGPFPGWTPVGLTGNRLLWRHDDGHASLWRLNDNGSPAGSSEHFLAGASVVNYANARLLWKYPDGKVSLWTMNAQDVKIESESVDYGPFPGWSVVNYANNRLLWRHTDGRISFWAMNDAGGDVRFHEYSVPGWTPMYYDNGELLWVDGTGRSSQWIMNRDGSVILDWQGQGVFTGFQPMAVRDRKFVWLNLSGGVSYWNVDWRGGYISHTNLSAGSGWVPLFTAGATPL